LALLLPRLAPLGLLRILLDALLRQLAFIASRWLAAAMAHPVLVGHVQTGLALALCGGYKRLLS
jgi:hypothetical protein